jgi:hypothetical protein
MSLPDFFKELKVDSWYKAIVYIGGAALLVSFFTDVKGITNIQLQLLAGGFFFLGIGEWKNHKKLTTIKPPNAYTGPAAYITYTLWKPDIIGLLFDLTGIALAIMGFVNIVKTL